MFESDQYQLIDFGRGRKLERFGRYILDRPCPAADGTEPRQPERWKESSCRFARGRNQKGRWQPAGALPKSWLIEWGPNRFELKPTAFGHVGVFVEQARNWDWISKRVRRAGDRPKILNLFAYTGGSTLAAALAGAEVVHVDAAKNVVQWARRNARQSGLSEAPVRWVVEDAARFVAREVKRGNQYDAVILDPPSYGHGPKGETWKLVEQLPELLSNCAALTARRRAFMLLTCHSPGYAEAELEALFADRIYGHCQAGAVAQPLLIHDQTGRHLHCGTVVRTR